MVLFSEASFLQIMATDFASGMIEAAKEYGKAYSNIQ